MQEKIIVARKDYECDYCGEIIKKGTKYKFSKAKYPKYDNNEDQIGIEYTQSRTHLKGQCFKKTFICSTCMEKTDDPKEYTYPISELANPWEDDPMSLICKECYQDFIDDENRAKYDEEFYD